MIRVWRVVATQHVETAFTGIGSERDDARWHFAGTRVVYASSEAGTAILEKGIQLGNLTRLNGFELVSATISEALVDATIPQLNAGWNCPLPTEQTKQIGTSWIKSQSNLALEVPSTLTPATNFLINPNHPNFSRLGVESRVPIAARILQNL